MAIQTNTNDDLEALLSIITTNVRSIQKAYKDRGQAYPSLNDANAPPEIMEPPVIQASMLTISAASQLIANLRMPTLSAIDAVTAMYSSSAIGFAGEANVVELLREAGPQGVHIRDIGKKIGASPEKTGRLLRYLASNRYIFREVSPDVFANNRISATLDTGKSYDELKKRSPSRYEDTNGVAAFVGHTADECFKGAVNMSDFVLDPTTSFSEDPKISPFSRWLGSEISLWPWYEQPENEKRLRRFGASMRMISDLAPQEMIFLAFDWQSLKPNDIIVDVGGGIGSTTLVLARKFGHVKYVVQDRAAVVPDGEKRWKTEFPEALESGLVKFQAHDFFETQPIKDASVFLLRFIIHDWPDAEAKVILKKLRESATPNTKLMLIENILPYACPVDDTEFAHIPGASLPPVPSPLVANLGAAQGVAYAADLQARFVFFCYRVVRQLISELQMMSILGALERTLPRWVEIGKETGWKLKNISRGPLNCLVYTVS